MPKAQVSDISILSDQAIDWVIRLHAGTVTEEEAAQAEAWQNRSPSHRKAFAEAEQLWLDMGEAVRMPVAQAALRQCAQPHRRAFRPRLAAAAGLLAVASMLWIFEFSDRWRSDYYTVAGEQRTLTLTDGSRVQLDTDTALSVAFNDTGRRITLLRGRALFAVAKDPRRPFEVAADAAVVMALGTVFEVLRDTHDTRITVEEHAVGVKGLHAKDYAPANRIAAGQQARYSAERGLSPPIAIDVKQLSAWRRGKLIFKNRPLVEVIAELDRYYPGRMLIIGGGLQTLRVTGVFPATDAAAALDMIADILPVKLMRVTPWLTLLRG